jgi:hypothetical protein
VQLSPEFLLLGLGCRVMSALLKLQFPFQLSKTGQSLRIQRSAVYCLKNGAPRFRAMFAIAKSAIDG